MQRVSVVVLPVVALLWFLVTWQRKEPTLLRIGTNQSPDFNFRDKSGKFTGFAVDVLNEAATRAGYRLEWVFAAEGPDIVLQSKLVDLWPILTDTPSRRRRFHLTKPWWKSDGALVTRADRRLQSWSELAGQAVHYSPNERALVEVVRWPPTTRLQFFSTVAEGLSAVCRGQGRAVWAAASVIRRFVLARPPGCEDVDLAMFQPAEGGLPYTIGATRERSREAEVLRDVIEEMSREGRVMQIAAGWRILELAHWDLLDTMVHTHQRNIRLLYGLAGVVLLSLALAWLAARARWDKLAAERVSGTRSQFLANMSHELRTPMSGVLGVIDLVLSSNLNQEQREQLLLARSSARSLLGILNDILDLTRIDSGKLVLERIAFSPREVAERSVRLLAGKAHAKRLELLLDTHPETPAELMGDPVRLQQVLLNLLGNAVKFTAEGYVKLTLRPETSGWGQVRLCCEVADTGIGIPRSKQQAIFELFTQADASTTRKYGGSGLGLTICLRLASLMNGDIKLNSEEGNGSRFQFTAQFGMVSMPAAELASAPEVLRNRRILVVDDSAEHVTQLRLWLSRHGMEGEYAESGSLAMAHLESGRVFDVVLVDTRLRAEEDGFAVAERLGALAGQDSILLALETLDLGGDAARCRRIGVTSYLTKPLTEWELCDRLRQMVTKTAAAPPPIEVSETRPPAGLSVLVAEDNRVNQLVARKLLEKAGHQVMVVENGREALDAISKQHFDVALFDMQMPEMGGVEAVTELRRLEREKAAPRLPVIAVTAHALAGDRERFLEAGLDDYLAKPLDAESLLRMVASVAAHRIDGS